MALKSDLREWLKRGDSIVGTSWMLGHSSVSSSVSVSLLQLPRTVGLVESNDHASLLTQSPQLCTFPLVPTCL